MKEKIKQLIVPGIMILAFAGYIFFVAHPSESKALLGAAAGWPNRYSSTTNIGTSMDIGLSQKGVITGTTNGPASSTQALASNTSRVFARIQNLSQNGYTVSCLLGSTATSTLPIGIVLAPLASSTLTSAFELNADNPYSGAIYCFSLSTTTISVNEN